MIRRFNLPVVHNSGDASIRDLERRLAQGDPSAAGPLAVAQIRATGALDPAWVQSMLGTPALVVVDQTLRQSGPQHRERMVPLYTAYGQILWRQALDVSQGQIRLLAATYIDVPNQFGNPAGTQLAISLDGQHQTSSYTFRHLPDDDEPRAQEMLNGPDQANFRVYARTDVNQAPPDVHPWYFNMHLSGPTEPGAPSRTGLETILLSELGHGGEPALVECVVLALQQLDARFQLVTNDLDAVRGRLGVHTYEDAVRLAQATREVSAGTFRDLRLALMSVEAPPASPRFTAWPVNAAGRAMAEAALLSLAGALRSHGAIVQLPRLYPWETNDVSSWTTTQIEVRGPRGRNTVHPLRVSVTWDTLNGLWSHMPGWRGNVIPPQGEWRIYLTEGVPATAQQSEPIVKAWLRDTLPGARVLVGTSGSRGGRYPNDVQWRLAAGPPQVPGGPT